MKKGLQQGRRIWEDLSYLRFGSSPSVVIFRQIMSSRLWSRRVHTGVEGTALQRFLPTIKEFGGEGDEESASVCDNGGSMTLEMKVEVPEPREGDRSPEQTTGSSRLTRWRWKSGGKFTGSGNLSWLDWMISSWLRPRSFTRETSDRTAGREGQMMTCCTRVLVGRRSALYGEVLTHLSGRVNPEAFGDGSG